MITDTTSHAAQAQFRERLTEAARTRKIVIEDLLWRRSPDAALTLLTVWSQGKAHHYTLSSRDLTDPDRARSREKLFQLILDALA